MPKKELDTRKKYIAIIGPTSSGKSSLAIEVAKRWNGEIISADSRQVYRGMNIGTGKVKKDNFPPTTHDKQHKTKNASLSVVGCQLYVSEGIPHHIIDIADPNDDYNISHFLRDARKALEDIANREKLPIICGGTGFWIQTLTENQSLPTIPPDPALREKLEKISTEELFLMLVKLDPKRAETIDKKNPRRLIRAIEIATSLRHPRENGDPVSTRFQRVHHKRSSPSDNFSARGTWIPTSAEMTEQEKNSLLVALCPNKEILDVKIKTRLDARFNEGMVNEVAQLHEEGVPWERLEAFGLEYRWISRYLRGDISEMNMKEKLFFDIIHYAKRQMTWIRRWQKKNPSLHIIETPAEAMEFVEAFLKTK